MIFTIANPSTTEWVDVDERTADRYPYDPHPPSASYTWRMKRLAPNHSVWAPREVRNLWFERGSGIGEGLREALEESFLLVRAVDGICLFDAASARWMSVNEIMNLAPDWSETVLIDRRQVLVELILKTVRVHFNFGDKQWAMTASWPRVPVAGDVLEFVTGAEQRSPESPPFWAFRVDEVRMPSDRGCPNVFVHVEKSPEVDVAIAVLGGSDHVVNLVEVER